MVRVKDKIPVVQNIGLADRMIRFFGGGILLAGGVLGMVLGASALLSTIALLLAVYPLMTTVMGWDPFYQLLSLRTCSLQGGRNQCGTFPYEVDAAIGHEPEPEKDYDHSLSGSHHSMRHKKVA